MGSSGGTAGGFPEAKFGGGGEVGSRGDFRDNAGGGGPGVVPLLPPGKNGAPDLSPRGNQENKWTDGPQNGGSRLNADKGKWRVKTDGLVSSYERQ